MSLVTTVDAVLSQTADGAMPARDPILLLLAPGHVRTSLLFDTPHLRGLTCARSMTDYRAFLIDMLQTSSPGRQ